ncbi:hypothetical protein J3R30DRAFT_3436019 [Lentinula aciculospora]|uniref:CST complex subunit STN1 n=1 Tax=Lentinula aciculospora TaxID=153920 RepID=A0A9W9AQU0_9AGAR|nr:hypothetical protein J3R30DRAFT_3436019 [Lentinula aciculospora]
MSLTAVLEARSNTGSVFLTPKKKKRRLGPETKLSTAEIYNWVFTSGAVAPCFICDIRAMKRHKEKAEEFWWLKRIPCRTVKIVGLVVGTQTYEKRVSYIVDDGTSVIECVHKCGAPPPSPSSVNDPVLTKPVAWIGNTVEILGRIYEFEGKESTEKYGQETTETRRQIQVQEIVQCQSVDNKLRHWQTVLDLHKNKYSLSEPFTIPRPLSVSASIQRSGISTPSTTASTTTTTDTPTSVSTLSASSSPTKSDHSHQSPRKLRHPSRLHTSDLTGNTFRIYIKHYMDNPLISEDSDIETDFSDENETTVAGPSTPTKRPFHDDQTPRRPRSYVADETPRPTRPLLSSKPSSRKGFTLSYLRRVPELSELARRVVNAEAKRRDRETKKRTKEASASQSRSNRSQGHKTQIPTATTSSTTSRGDSISARMKRLWKWAIVQLIQEGSIILWDGPKYPITSNLFNNSMNSRIWKSSSSSSTAVNTTFTSDISVFSSSREGETGEYVDLSDPDPGEEAYVALTTELLAGEVERVLQTWLIARRFSESPKFTKAGILQRLQRDDRWRRVGEWHVQEAVDLLVSRGLLYEILENAWGFATRFSQRSTVESTV